MTKRDTRSIWNCRRLLEIQYVIVIILRDDWPIFMISASNEELQKQIGMHPTKAWLSQLVNFKNAIWHFRRTTCNKILF